MWWTDYVELTTSPRQVSEQGVTVSSASDRSELRHRKKLKITQSPAPPPARAIEGVSTLSRQQHDAFLSLLVRLSFS
jgi:hypothetical protein